MSEFAELESVPPRVYLGGLNILDEEPLREALVVLGMPEDDAANVTLQPWCPPGENPAWRKVSDPADPENIWLHTCNLRRMMLSATNTGTVETTRVQRNWRYAQGFERFAGDALLLTMAKQLANRYTYQGASGKAVRLMHRHAGTIGIAGIFGAFLAGAPSEVLGPGAFIDAMSVGAITRGAASLAFGKRISGFDRRDRAISENPNLYSQVRSAIEPVYNT